MKRDFSESARQKLISLCEEVESEKICNFTDKIGDGWYEFEEWLGTLSIEKYLDNVNAYHKKVIDKNNATEDDINEIFENVNSVSTSYKTRFDSILSNLESYNKIINQLAETIEPSNGKFTSDYIAKDLDEAVNEYLKEQATLESIYGEGLDADDIENIDEEAVTELLAAYVSSFADSLPSTSLDLCNEELLVTPTVKVYYKQSVSESFGDSDLKVSEELKEQQLLVKNISVSTETDGLKLNVGSSGSISISSSDSDSTDSIGINLLKGGFTGSKSVTVDGRTVKITYSFNPLTGVISAEITVSATVDGKAVTTTTGIEISLYTATMQSIDGTLYKVYVPSEYYVPLSAAELATVTTYVMLEVAGVAFTVGTVIVGPEIVAFVGGVTNSALAAVAAELSAYAAKLGYTLSLCFA